MIWQRWVSRSRVAPVRRSEPRTSGHDSNGRFVVTMRLVRSYAVAITSKTIYAQPDAAHVHGQFDEIVSMLTRQYPDAARILNDAAVLRLVSAVVAETHDEWQDTERRYLAKHTTALLYEHGAGWRGASPRFGGRRGARARGSSIQGWSTHVSPRRLRSGTPRAGRTASVFRTVGQLSR